MNPRILLLLALCAWPLGPANAAASPLEALTEQLETTGAPSLSIAVARDGEIIFAEAVGLADPKAGIPATSKTQYRVYSISKAMTAVAALQLVETGVVGLDDDVRQWVSEFPEKRWPVQVHHLLTHTSGVRHYKKNAGEINATREYASFADGLAIFKDDPLEFEPGTKHLYTSFGFNLLSGVIERASGVPFERWLEDSLWAPAGMRATSLAVRGRENSQLAAAHSRKDNGKGPNRRWRGELPNMSAKFGSSGVVSTPTDLVKFVLALVDGKLLTPAMRDRMWAPAVPDIRPEQSLGWIVGELEGRRVIASTGASAGYTGVLLYFPDEELVGALLTNVTPFKERTSALLEVMKAVEATSPTEGSTP